MASKRAWIVAALAVALAAIGVGRASAQGATGQIAGRVVDAAGAPVAGAAVSVHSIGGGAPVTATTGADGSYSLAVAPGIYRAQFSAPGAEPALRAGLVVIEGGHLEVNVTLRSPGAAEPAPLREGEVLVRVDTPLGSIDLAIDVKRAPVTAANFLKYVDAGLYTGGRFHRATRPDNYTPAPPNRPAMELIQGGINPARKGEGFPAIPLERTSVTGLKHVVGTVSMARGTADTATSDFFILLDDQPSLDFGGRRFDDAQGAAAFGRVVGGLGVVRRIQQQPVQGQNLTPPVPIIRISRVIS
jgi:peptidyl-prolyl cis-trans isomerase A (cyclophilin A)